MLWKKTDLSVSEGPVEAGRPMVVVVVRDEVSVLDELMVSHTACKTSLVRHLVGVVVSFGHVPVGLADEQYDTGQRTDEEQGGRGDTHD